MKNEQSIFVPSKLLEEAAERFSGNLFPDDIEWYSWPQPFGTTAGPHRGVGGTEITNFQVFGFRSPLGEGLLCCAGIWKEWHQKELKW